MRIKIFFFPKMPRFFLTFLGLLTALLVSSCSLYDNDHAHDEGHQDDEQTRKTVIIETLAEDEQITVVASFYPPTFLAERVGGEHVDVVNLAQSQDPHHYNPSPQDIVAMHKADLVVLQGAGMEPWSEGIMSQLAAKGVPVLVLNDHLTLREASGHDDEHEEHEDGHDDHHEEDHAEENAEHRHDHGAYDPHSWLDPDLATVMTTEIRDTLKQIAPQHATDFDRHAADLTEQFADLNTSYRQGLSSCAHDEIIVAHNALLAKVRS